MNLVKKNLLKSANCPCHIFIIIQHSQLSKKQNLGPQIAKQIDENDQQSHLIPNAYKWNDPLQKLTGQSDNNYWKEMIILVNI